MNYEEIVANVNSFYTNGSAAVDYLNSLELTAEELGQIIDASDRFNVVRNADGEIINFTQRVDLVQSTTDAIDSNIGTSATTSVDIPLTATTTQTGKLLIGQGLTGGMTGVQFLTQSVIPAIGAVGTGIALGKAIDSTLYNLNPDFWDSNGMGTLNPETWNSITTNDDISGRMFNMMFGLNPNDLTVQPYIEQNTLAYLIQYMIEQGVFDVGGSHSVLDPTVTARLYFTEYFPGTTGLMVLQPNVMVDFYTLNARRWTGVEIRNNSSPVVCFISQPFYDIDSFMLNFYSLDPFQYRTSDQSVFTDASRNSTQVSSGSSAYIYGQSVSSGIQSSQSTANRDNIYSQWSGIVDLFQNLANEVSYMYARYNFAYALLTGDIETSQAIEGISDQTGATVFDPSSLPSSPTIADILSALQTQLPSLFTDAVTQPLPHLDPDPVNDPVYIPIGTPQVNPLNPIQPIGDIATQQDPVLDPETVPEQTLNDLIDDVINPDPVPPDGINTGGGVTPPIVTPEGTSGALFTAYNPTQNQVDAFGAWLWSSDFVDQLKKIFNDPMESIISLHKIFASPTVGTAQHIYVGYLDSEVSSAIITDQYCDVDCGSVTLSEYFRNVYDYVDTKVSLYLPFIGIVPLDVSEIMRSTISIVYHVDVLTGACLADVEVVRDAAGGVLYQYSGDCAVHYPVSAGSYMGIVTGILSIAGGIAGTIATGGAMAPTIIGAGAAATRLHRDVSKSGGFSGNSGAMGCKIPYLIISRPQTALPETYLSVEGIGSNQTVLLDSCTGFVRVKNVIISGINATGSELTEIETLLKAGVIL